MKRTALLLYVITPVHTLPSIMPITRKRGSPVRSTGKQVFVFPQGLGLLKVEAVLHFVDRTLGGVVFKFHADKV